MYGLSQLFQVTPESLKSAVQLYIRLELFEYQPATLWFKVKTYTFAKLYVKVILLQKYYYYVPP
jgi:hypothetical protein